MNNETFEKKLSKAKIYAYRLLAYRSRSCMEIRERLKRKGFSGKIIDSVLKTLKEFNYVNDREFSKIFVEIRFSTNPCGRKLIEYELMKKGVEEKIISDTCEEAFAGDKEHELASALAVKKLSRCRGLDLKTKWKRLFGLLCRRSFPPGMVNEILSEILGEPG